MDDKSICDYFSRNKFHLSSLSSRRKKGRVILTSIRLLQLQFWKLVLSLAFPNTAAIHMTPAAIFMCFYISRVQISFVHVTAHPECNIHLLLQNKGWNSTNIHGLNFGNIMACAIGLNSGIQYTLSKWKVDQGMDCN